MPMSDRNHASMSDATPRLALLLLLVLAGAQSAWAQDFYRERLERGRQALSAQQYEEASTDLEIACFGMMDNPARRAGCKAFLFLAQRGAGEAVSATETLRLIARLEERFAAFSGASLDAENRQEFLLEADASGVDLSVWPRLQQTVAAAVGAIEDSGASPRSLTPAELERASRADPGNVDLATALVVSKYERGKYADVQNSAEDLLARDPNNATASCLLAVASATRNRSLCARALDAIEACSPDLQDRRYARTRLQCYVDLERWQESREYSDRLTADLRNSERRLIRQIERQSEPSVPSTNTAAATPGADQSPLIEQAPQAAPDPLEAEVEALRRRQAQAVEDRDVEGITSVLDQASRLAEERPNYGPLRELAGQAAYLLSRWDQALYHLRAADAVHEIGAFSLFYLATALEKTGEIDAARATLQRGLEAGLPRAPQVIALEQRLQSGA